MNKTRKNYRLKTWDNVVKTTRAYRLAHPWLKTLSNVRQRCTNPDFPKYKYYGGKGIKAEITSMEKRNRRSKKYK